MAETQRAFGARIRDAREKKGETLSQVADKCGFSGAYLSKVERSEVPAPLRWIKAMASALELDLAELETAAEVDRDEAARAAAADVLMRTDARLGVGVRSGRVPMERVWQFVPDPPTTSWKQALNELIREMTVGVKHGSFRMTVSSSVLPDNRRRIVIDAGRIYEFDVCEEEVEVRPF
jgi:transcriptional regulator with XRE-family HTH domain